MEEIPEQDAEGIRAEKAKANPQKEKLTWRAYLETEQVHA